MPFFTCILFRVDSISDVRNIFVTDLVWLLKRKKSIFKVGPDAFISNGQFM
jgi:hypothetical protein